MRFLILLVGATLVTFRPGPADAVTIGLSEKAIGQERTAGSQTDPAVAGFGHWVALDGDVVLVGARGDADSKEVPVEAGFIFNTRNGKMLHRFDRPAVAQPNLVKPGILIDSYEIRLPAEIDAQPVEPMRISMGTGMLNWTAHRMAPSATNFRRAVASDDRRILIGAAVDMADDSPREVHLYSSETGDLLQSFEAPADAFGSDHGDFGQAVALNRDLVLIGAPGDGTDGPNAGGAYLYSAETGRLLHRFGDPEASHGNRFGTSVAMNESTIAVGAPGDGSEGGSQGNAYLFSSSDYVMTQALDAPWDYRTGERPWGHGQGDLWHSMGRGRLAGMGGGGGSGGGGGGSGYHPGGDPDDELPTIIIPDPNDPDPEMPETPIAIPLPGGFALYLAALSLGGLAMRRRGTS